MANPMPDEQHYMELAQRGDLDAFNALVLHYQDRIYTIAYRILGEPAAAADAAQEALLSAYRKLEFVSRRFILFVAGAHHHQRLLRRTAPPAPPPGELAGGNARRGDG